MKKCCFAALVGSSIEPPTGFGKSTEFKKKKKKKRRDQRVAAGNVHRPSGGGKRCCNSINPWTVRSRFPIGGRGEGEGTGQRRTERWKKRQSPLDACNEREVALPSHGFFSKFHPLAKKTFEDEFSRQLSVIANLLHLVFFFFFFQRSLESTIFPPFFVKIEERWNVAGSSWIRYKRPRKGGASADINREIDRSDRETRARNPGRAEVPLPVGANFGGAIAPDIALVTGRSKGGHSGKICYGLPSWCKIARAIENGAVRESVRG